MPGFENANNEGGRTVISAAKTVRILGIPFFDGSARAAVERLCRSGGYVVAPAAPALVKVQHDLQYRRALLEADLAIADSGFMVLLFRILHGLKVTRISGLIYLKALLHGPHLRESGGAFWVLPSKIANRKASQWLSGQNFQIWAANFYVAPRYGTEVADARLIALLDAQRPAHVVVAIGGGTQEKLGLFLRENLSYRPAIHCIGAALGFLTGDQRPIPMWADRFYLGWLLRLLRQPRVFGPRYLSVLKLPLMIARHGSELPPMVPE